MNVPERQLTAAKTDHVVHPDAATVQDVLDGVEGAAARFEALIAEEIAAKDFVILPLADYFDGYESFLAGCSTLSAALGRLMEQNEAGATVIEVYDRNIGRIEEGARYHQTRQGGDIHIDSVNRPEPMKYLILGCAAPASVGGESILIRAGDVLERLQAYPGVLDTLSQPFIFEGRGMSAEPELFRMPVLQQTDQGPAFRYLRTYIESAHERAGEPLTPEQVFAFDVLDSILEQSDVQYRGVLQQGDYLITADTRVFHGRTRFVDMPKQGAWTPGRCMLRYWAE